MLLDATARFEQGDGWTYRVDERHIRIVRRRAWTHRDAALFARGGSATCHASAATHSRTACAPLSTSPCHPRQHGGVAWFDERLHNAKLGTCRGSGVLVRQEQDDGDGAWKVAQYNLMMAVPNEHALEVAALASRDENGQ